MNQKAPLFTIRPDPNQPRSLLPPDLVGLFTNGLMSPQVIMAEWLKSPNQALNAIITLADSIAQHGQINPISVQPAQNGLPSVKYLIVTGERRWWAHVLLLTQGRYIYEGNTRNPADQIKISLVTKGVSIRAHQLIENVVREDLDAVEKAHGMWALRYELSGKNYEGTLPTSAQERQLVGWDKVEKSLAVSSRYRQYVTSVLKLTPDALRLVAEHGLSESTIRPITQKLPGLPNLQMQALRQLVAWQESEDKHSLVKEVKELVTGLVAEIPEADPVPRPSLLPLELPHKRAGESKAAVPTKVPAEVPAAYAPTKAQAVDPAVAQVQAAVAPSPCLSSSAGPIQATTAAPMPELAAVPRGDRSSFEQESFIPQNQTLRSRPNRASHTHSNDLGSAIDSLLTRLDQIDPHNPVELENLTDNKEGLMTLKDQIEQIMRLVDKNDKN